MTGRPQAIIFDFDGTLAELNIDFELMARRVEMLSREMGFAELWPAGYLLEAMAQVQQVLGDGFDKKARQLIQDIEVAAAAKASLFEFTRPLMTNLARLGVKRGVISRNCDAAIRTVFPDIDDCCEVFVPREAAPRPKPHPDHVLQALGVLGVNAGSAWMVGDHPTDIQAGKAAGCRCVGVASGRTGVDQLRDAGADDVLADIGQMIVSLEA